MTPEIRPLLIGCLESVTCSSTPTEAACAVCDLFRLALPPLLLKHNRLLRDYPDLDRGVRIGLPIALCLELRQLTASPVVERLYPQHVRSYVCRAADLLARKLDTYFGFLAWADAVPRDEAEARLLIWLEDEIRRFSASVLLSGPRPAPTTAKQRAAARRRRFNDYCRVSNTLQNGNENFTTLCRRAGCQRNGRGSGAKWLNGQLKDSAVTSRRIEAVLSFRCSSDEIPQLTSLRPPTLYCKT